MKGTFFNSSNIKLFLFISLILVASPRAKADDGNYHLTKQLCTGHDSLRFAIMWNSAFNFGKILASNNSDELNKVFAQRGFTDSTIALMKSVGYQKALDECYPGDIEKQKRFATRLHVDDVLGESLAAAGFYRVGVYFYEGVISAGALVGLSARTTKIIFWSAGAFGGAADYALRYYTQKAKYERYQKIHRALGSLIQDDLPRIDNDIANYKNQLSQPGLSDEDRQEIGDELSKLKAIRDGLSH